MGLGKCCEVCPRITKKTIQGKKNNGEEKQVQNQFLFGIGEALAVEAKHGEHCKTPILDLLHLQLCECVRVIGQTQGVEWAARVQAVQILTKATRRGVGTSDS